jgi:hypothetical protein
MVSNPNLLTQRRKFCCFSLTKATNDGKYAPTNIKPKTTKKITIPGLVTGAPRVKIRPETRISGKNPTIIMITPEII